jgi:hypothetical protein
VLIIYSKNNALKRLNTIDKNKKTLLYRSLSKQIEQITTKITTNGNNAINNKNMNINNKKEEISGNFKNSGKGFPKFKTYYHTKASSALKK